MAAVVAGGGVVSMVKFRPMLGVDTMMKNGVTVNISTRHICITAMGAYKNSSLEELRLAHYETLPGRIVQHTATDGTPAVGPFGPFIGIPPAPRFPTPQNAWTNPGGTDQQGHASPRNPFSVIGNPGRTFINAARTLRKKHTKTHPGNKQQGTCTKATNTMVTTDSLLSERMDVIEQRVAHLEVTSMSRGQPDRPASNHVTTKCTPEPKRDATCKLGDGISDKMIGQSGTLLLFKNENRLHQYMGQRNIKLANAHVFFSDKTRTVALMVNPNNATWNSSANMLSNGIRQAKWRTAGSSASSSAPPMQEMADLNVDVTRPKSHHATWSTNPSRREPSKGEGISNASSSAYARRLQWMVGEGLTPGSGVFTLGPGTDRPLDGISRVGIIVPESSLTHSSAPIAVMDAKGTNAKVSSPEGINTEVANTEVTKSEVIKAEVTNTEVANTEVTNTEVTNTEVTKAEVTKTEVTNAHVINAELTNAEGTNAKMLLGRTAGDRSHATDDKVTDDRVTDVKVTDDKVTDDKVTDDKVTDVKVTDDKVTDDKVTDDKVTDVKVTDDKVTETEVTDDYVRVRSNCPLESSVCSRLEGFSRLADLFTKLSITHSGARISVANAKVTKAEAINAEAINAEATNAEATNTEAANAEATNAEATNAEGPQQKYQAVM